MIAVSKNQLMMIHQTVLFPRFFQSVYLSSFWLGFAVLVELAAFSLTGDEFLSGFHAEQSPFYQRVD